MTHPLRRAATTTLAVATLATSLAGCFPLFVGGAVATGVVAMDRRSSGTQLDDESIELRAARRLSETLGDTARIKAISYNRQVLLTGEVPNTAARQQAEAAVARLDGVRGVVNALDVTVSPSFQQRSADTVVTGRVKASLIDAKDLQSGAFKVTTERNVVYLMGRVTEREASRAVDIARGVGGVEKVVRVFDIVTEQELAGGAPPAPAPQAAPAAAPAPQPAPAAGASIVAPVVTPIPPQR